MESLTAWSLRDRHTHGKFPRRVSFKRCCSIIRSAPRLHTWRWRSDIAHAAPQSGSSVASFFRAGRLAPACALALPAAAAGTCCCCCCAAARDGSSRKSSTCCCCVAAWSTCAQACTSVETLAACQHCRPSQLTKKIVSHARMNLRSKSTVRAKSPVCSSSPGAPAALQPDQAQQREHCPAARWHPQRGWPARRCSAGAWAHRRASQSPADQRQRSPAPLPPAAARGVLLMACAGCIA